MMEALAFACPRCHAPLQSAGVDELRCPEDGLRFLRTGGVWRFLLPERAPVYSRFIGEYETVRRAEGRGSAEAAYYRALPYDDVGGRMRADWRIRAASFDVFLARVLSPLEKYKPVLRVLDLGAGNGWLSNRLAQRGHQVAAVDLTVNDFDGLGCYRYYASRFSPLQAEFDRLPLAAGSVDLLVFNASLHYSVDIQVTLEEALRVLGDAGTPVIMDTPLYRDGASGAQMVREREAGFARRFGFRSDALPSENFLTYDRLALLGSRLGLEWQLLTPWYGAGWALKPFKAAILGRREPARFHVIVGRRGGRLPPGVSD
jgi:SAM-dependent methyltransferase